MQNEWEGLKASVKQSIFYSRNVPYYLVKMGTTLFQFFFSMIVLMRIIIVEIAMSVHRDTKSEHSSSVLFIKLLILI